MCRPKTHRLLKAPMSWLLKFPGQISTKSPMLCWHIAWATRQDLQKSVLCTYGQHCSGTWEGPEQKWKRQKKSAQERARQHVPSVVAPVPAPASPGPVSADSPSLQVQSGPAWPPGWAWRSPPSRREQNLTWHAQRRGRSSTRPLHGQPGPAFSELGPSLAQPPLWIKGTRVLDSV